MSIFVDPEKMIPIIIRYISITNEYGDETGVKIVNDPEIVDGVKTLICKTRGRNFGHMEPVLENCTVINHITGKPMLRTMPLYRAVILTFFAQWGDSYNKSGELKPLLNNDGSVMLINEGSIQLMHDSLVKALAKKWLKQTG